MTKYFLLLSLSLSIGNRVALDGAITFDLNFIDSPGATWSPERRAVVVQATEDWGQLFGSDHTISLSLRFTNGTSYVAAWSPTILPGEGANTRPWDDPSYTIFHRITVNADYLEVGASTPLWFDPTPSTDDDVSGQGFDALTVFRHELGHLMGMTMNLGLTPYYVDNAGPDQIDVWGQNVGPGNVFDASGLNVTLSSDWIHLSNSGAGADDLMIASISPSVRKGISELDIAMLNLAYGYGLASVPEPTALGLSLGFLALGLAVGKRRRRA